MNNLIIDCSEGMNLSVISNEKIFSFEDSTACKHSDDVLVEIDNLLNQAKLKINQINNICVCIGPGSFTGVRVAISIAKGLAIGTGAKIFVCSNLDSFKYSLNKKSIFVLGGFSEFVYARIYDGKNYEDKCISKNDLKDEKYKDYEFYVPNEKTQKLLILSEIPAIICENNIKNVFFDKIKKNDFIEINKIEPIYLRASQAELERNKKLNGEK